jgi:hypothetical protein
MRRIDTLRKRRVNYKQFTFNFDEIDKRKKYAED